MDRVRRRYVTALVLAIVVLLGSMGAAAVFVGSRVGQSVWHASPGMNPPGDSDWAHRKAPGGGTGRGGEAVISAADAQSRAQDWVEKNAPGASLSAATRMPMGYVFTATKDGRVVARIVVDGDDGSVVVRNRVPADSSDGTSASPAPSSSSTP